MKHLYSTLYKISLTLLLLLCLQVSKSQCPGGYVAGETAYDTIIPIPPGATSTTVKFPKFNPINGMITCMRLCMSVTGVVDNLSFENNDISSPNTYTADYNRTDILTGPGIISPIMSTIAKHYSFNLGVSNGIPGSGPDFGSVSNDTIRNPSAECRQINDSVTLSNFYGLDSLAYTYTSFGGVNIGSSPNATISIATSAFVRLRLQYCTCPASALPINVRFFEVYKLTSSKVELKWRGFDDPNSNYRYETEVSRNAYSFTTFDSKQKSEDGVDNPYSLNYEARDGESGDFYFRIKQVYANGYVRYSNIQHVTLESSDKPKFYIYPNPSNGIVGIKFDTRISGQFDILIYNTQGQVIVKKDVMANGSSYLEVTRLSPGVYWLKLTDRKSQLSSVNQLLIK